MSSTLYNAVLLAGLPITERHNHSRPPKYVGPGRDATVVYPGKDFRFVNDTDQPLLLLARLEDDSLEVSLLGLKPMAEQVSLTVEILEECPSGRKRSSIQLWAPVKRRWWKREVLVCGSVSGGPSNGRMGPSGGSWWAMTCIPGVPRGLPRPSLTAGG